MTTTAAPFSIYSPGATNGPPNSAELAAMATSVHNALANNFLRVKTVANTAARTSYYNTFGTPSATNPCVVWRADAVGNAYLEATITNDSGWFALGDTGSISWATVPGGITVGNGTLSQTYSYSGGKILVSGRFVLGSTSAITGAITPVNPVSAVGKDALQYSLLGAAILVDAGVGLYSGAVYANGASGVTIRVLGAAGTYASLVQLSSTVPFTWGAGDSVSWSYSYSYV